MPEEAFHGLNVVFYTENEKMLDSDNSIHLSSQSIKVVLSIKQSVETEYSE